MGQAGNHQGVSYRVLYKALNDHWTQLCASYLPVTPEDSVWRYSRQAQEDDPDQGWKLHVSATVLTASSVLEKVAPFLQRRRILFKAPASLEELDKLNRGIFYGYCQVGKFITVYPGTAEEAARLLPILHKLTRGMVAPVVPYDRRFRPDSCIYYRYGSFNVIEMEKPGGGYVLALRDPAGKLVPDVRDSETARPDWVPDLFPAPRRRRRAREVVTPLKTTFRVFRALSQRGKGGVYQALDLTAKPRLCVLKEGRKNGEVDWDGRDGYWRIKHEEQVLASLRAAGVNVPHIYASFEAEKNYYLAIEFIEGVTLEQFLSAKRRRLSISRVLALSIQISSLMAQIHDAGWVWRDCKPHNLLIVKVGGGLRPLDFEGACRVSQPDPMPWGTDCYVPPEWDDESGEQSRLPQDLYALGVLIYTLLTGCPPEISTHMPIENLRRNVPASVCQLIMELLDADPSRRPPARTVNFRLMAAATSLN